jgi:hypothetical protein
MAFDHSMMFMSMQMLSENILKLPNFKTENVSLLSLKVQSLSLTRFAFGAQLCSMLQLTQHFDTFL